MLDQFGHFLNVGILIIYTDTKTTHYFELPGILITFLLKGTFLLIKEHAPIIALDPTDNLGKIFAPVPI
jgi:hypothetical protein